MKNIFLNKKKFYTISIYSLIIFFAISSCSKDDVVDPYLKVDSNEEIEVSNQGGEYSIAILSTYLWTATSDVDWIILNSDKGDKGKEYLDFSVVKNEGEERIGTVTVNTVDNQYIITVVQEKGLTTEFYVKPNGTGSGESWNDAASFVFALEEATSGSTIHMAAGTYTPTKIITGGSEDDPSDKTFEINKHLEIIGGYPENPSNGDQPDSEVNKTILSGKISEEDDVYHVVTISAPKADNSIVTIKGLTITGGNAYNRGSQVSINGVNFNRGVGGGIIIGNTIAELIDLTVIENITSSIGTSGMAPGIFVFGGAEVTLRNCKVNQNHSVGNGGGLWVDRSVAYIYDSEFNENSGGTAPGVHAYPDAEIYMYNSVIANNKGRSYGAAFYARGNSYGLIANSLIYGNESTSPNGGGGIMMYDNCEIDLISTTIVDNSIAGPGGGVYRRNGNNKIGIYNSIISGNTQIEGSTDVDVYEADATSPIIVASVISEKVFDINGSEVSDATFNADNLLDDSYYPRGENNPAEIYGMDLNSLHILQNSFQPKLEDKVLFDYLGASREDHTTMGALIK